MSKPRVVAIVQARTGSSRLPNKVLEPLAGQPMLARVVDRLGQASSLDAVVVATTDLKADDRIEELCRERGWSVFRGSETDLTDRYYRCAQASHADIVVRVTSDCPLIDAGIVDRVVDALLDQPTADNATNVLPHHTWPRGLDVEAVRFAALERVWEEDTNPAWREHATYYIRQHPERFETVRVANPDSRAPNARRWTVDTPEDLAFVRRVYDQLGDDSADYDAILRIVEEHPEWSALNAGVSQKPVPE